MKPAPMPWAYRPREFDDWGWIRDASGETVGRAFGPLDDDEANRQRAAKTDPWEASARRIVQCVNAHGELIAVLISARRTIEWALHLYIPNYDPSDHSGIRQIDAALAKARGEG